MAQIDASAEVTWSFGGQKFRSTTFSVTVESPVTDDISVATPDPELYPTPSEVARKSDLAAYPAPATIAIKGDLVTLREVPNRFTANRNGWKIGDIIKQHGDSTFAQATISCHGIDPGASGTVTITTQDLPDQYGGSWGFDTALGLGGNWDFAGPLTAAEWALQLATAFGGETSDNITWLADNKFVWTCPSVGDMSFSLNNNVYFDFEYDNGRDPDYGASTWLSFYNASSSFDVNSSFWPGASDADVASAIANDIANQCGIVDVRIENGNTVVLTWKDHGANTGFYGGSDPGLISSQFDPGVDGVPPGMFIVANLGALGESTGYQAIGKTVDFLSGYGAPTNDIGSEGNGYVDQNNGDFYHRDEFGWTYVLNIQGPLGPRGYQGVQGIQGPQGPSGGGIVYAQYSAYAAAVISNSTVKGALIGSPSGQFTKTGSLEVSPWGTKPNSYQLSAGGYVTAAAGTPGTITFQNVNLTNFPVITLAASATYEWTYESVIVGEATDGHFTGYARLYWRNAAGAVTIYEVGVGTVSSVVTLGLWAWFSVASTSNTVRTRFAVLK